MLPGALSPINARARRLPRIPPTSSTQQTRCSWPAAPASRLVPALRLLFPRSLSADFPLALPAHLGQILPSLVRSILSPFLPPVNPRSTLDPRRPPRPALPRPTRRLASVLLPSFPPALELNRCRVLSSVRSASALRRPTVDRPPARLPACPPSKPAYLPPSPALYAPPPTQHLPSPLTARRSPTAPSLQICPGCLLPSARRRPHSVTHTTLLFLLSSSPPTLLEHNPFDPTGRPSPFTNSFLPTSSLRTLDTACS